MVNDKSVPKYKYLTIYVTAEKNHDDALYDFTYTVTGIDSYTEVNILGFYDSAEKCQVTLMSNKNIFEYDWTTVISRIACGGRKEYLDLFKDDKHIIIVSNAVPIDNGNFKLSHAFPGYTLQFVNTEVYEMSVKDENLVEYDDVKKKKQEAERDEAWKKRYGKIPEDNRPSIVFEKELKASSPHSWPDGLTAFALGVILIAGIALTASIVTWLGNNLFSEPVTPEVQVSITKNPYTYAYAWTYSDSISMYDPAEKARADSIYAESLAQRADSIMESVRVRDSVVAELPKEKKVQVELTAVIEDGITTRRVQTQVILDTIREADMRNLTHVITTMATNMAKDRQAEIDTTKSYYKFVKSQDEMAWSN